MHEELGGIGADKKDTLILYSDLYLDVVELTTRARNNDEYAEEKVYELYLNLKDAVEKLEGKKLCL